MPTGSAMSESVQKVLTPGKACVDNMYMTEPTTHRNPQVPGRYDVVVNGEIIGWVNRHNSEWTAYVIRSGSAAFVGSHSRKRTAVDEVYIEREAS